MFVRLLGRDIDVDLNAGIFVTLNPAGKKYGGRSKLPDNLKALFRPVAMGRPDNELIAEVRSTLGELHQATNENNSVSPRQILRITTKRAIRQLPYFR